MTMLSRVANSIFWLYRNVERVENSARFLDVNFNLALDLTRVTAEQWSPLIQVLGAEKNFESLYQKYDRNSVIEFICFNEGNPNSIWNCINKARENARSVRGHLTKELWEQINKLWYYIQQEREQSHSTDPDPRIFVDKVKRECQLFYGISDCTISQNEGWHFGKIGVHLERADNTSRMLDVKYHILLPSLKSVGTTIDRIQWVALLKSVSAYNMYSRKHGRLVPLHIAEFLILDQEFPRSILHCLQKAEQSLKSISGNYGQTFQNQAEKQIGLIRSDLSFAEIDEIFQHGLHEFLDQIQIKVNSISDAIYQTYFSIKHQDLAP